MRVWRHRLADGVFYAFPASGRSEMNKGKICVSVCAETVDELLEQIKRAEELADVIEIRFDCLAENEFDIRNSDESERVLRKILVENPVENEIILTFRSPEQGGKRNISKEDRDDFWGSGYDHWGADLEEDIFEVSGYWLYEPRICSYHDFSGVPDNLDEIYQRIRTTELVDIIKIAVQADDIADTIPIWKLLEQAKSENRQIIPIAMGASGKWTRILGLAHGASMTYAALDAGSETAPGQVSARDLIDVYRVKELNEETGIYGILGGNTSYSMSPYIHNAAFQFHRLNAVFVPLQVQNLDEFMRRMVKPATREIELNLKGFAVTIPHKQNIVRHLDAVDETARAIGAVNTVKIEDGKLFGYNTDARGFVEPLIDTYGDLKNARVAVFGAGGASRAICYALKTAGADVTVMTRNLEKAEPLKADFDVQIEALSTAKNYKDFDILVNATPLGTKGELENETPAVASQIEPVKLVYDLIYNPFETRFIKEAKSLFVPTLGGLSMLIAQAMAQQKIWTGIDAPLKEMSAAALRRLATK
jgi:3-dehydroquinate dehydratase / shikimate dehydrogenase